MYKYKISIILLFLFSVSFTISKKEKVNEKEDKPNIILIVVDDLGYKDLSCMGSEYYETPNIDQLAKEGMIFTDAYASASNCAPSRACLLTGTNTPRHGVYTVGKSDRGKAKFRKIVPVRNTEFVNDSIITLADELKSAGYVTCNIGKWHIGENPGVQGIDYNVGGGKWGHPGSYFAPYKYPKIEAPEGEYLTDRLTSEAITFVEKNKNKPFFLYFPYYTVHNPLMGKEHLIEKYIKKGGADCQSNAKYAAMIENLDSCIGSLLQKVEDLDLTKKTMIIFTSDNGGIRVTSCQNPLRSGKGSYYEGGIRVPLFIKWQNKIKSETIEKTPVTNMDFYPTILEAIGVKPRKKQLDGKSILPILKQNGAIKQRPLFWHFPIYLQAYRAGFDQGRDPLFRTRPGSVVRFGNWKLHEYFEDGDIELYNLKDDIGEMNNVADEYPEKVTELHNMLIKWRKQTGAPVPTKENEKYDPLAEKEAIKKKTK